MNPAIAFAVPALIGAGVTLSAVVLLSALLGQQKKKKRLPASTYLGTGKVEVPEPPKNLRELVEFVSNTATPKQQAAYGAALSRRGYLVLGRRLTLLGAGKAPATARTYTVRAGDTGQKVAKEITGDFRRWPELEGAKTSRGTLKIYTGPSGYKQFKPWRVGLVITLPKGFK